MFPFLLTGLLFDHQADPERALKARAQSPGRE